MVFIYHDTSRDTICFKRGSCECVLPRQNFINSIESYTGKQNLTPVNEYIERMKIINRPKTIADELTVDSLLIAWTLYIIVMVGAIILNDCIMIWIVASYIFFRYRNKKLREVGFRK